MSLHIESRNTDGGNLRDANVRRQLLQLLVWKEAFHRDQASSGRDQAPRERGERRQVGKGTRDDDIEQKIGAVILDALGAHLDVGKPELDDRLPQKHRLLVVAIEQYHVPIRL